MYGMYVGRFARYVRMYVCLTLTLRLAFYFKTFIVLSPGQGLAVWTLSLLLLLRASIMVREVPEKKRCVPPTRGLLDLQIHPYTYTQYMNAIVYNISLECGGETCMACASLPKAATAGRSRQLHELCVCAVVFTSDAGRLAWR